MFEKLCHHALEPSLSFGKCWNYLDSERKPPDILNFTDQVQACHRLGLLLNTWQVARRSGLVNHAKFHEVLLQWRQKFESLQDVDHKTKINRGMWWQELEIMFLLQAELDRVSQVFSISNQAWDNYEEKFLKIVSLAEEFVSTPGVSIPVFSLCPNITTVMLRTVIRCRSPEIRRRAIQVIEVANTQEGLLKPEWTLQITRRIVALEEEGLSVKHAKDIPETSRLRDVSIDWDASAPSALNVKYYIKGKAIVERLGPES